jgi:hypothetical protein
VSIGERRAGALRKRKHVLMQVKSEMKRNFANKLTDVKKAEETRRTELAKLPMPTRRRRQKNAVRIDSHGFQR